MATIPVNPARAACKAATGNSHAPGTKYTRTCFSLKPLSAKQASAPANRRPVMVSLNRLTMIAKRGSDILGRQQMSEFVTLGIEIRSIVIGRRNLDRLAAGDLDRKSTRLNS